MLAQKLYQQGIEFAQAWNFGPEDPTLKSVGWITSYILNEWGNAWGWTTEDAEHPYESQQLRLDCSKARTKLKWQPRWNLEQSLSATIAWYKAYAKKENMRDFTLEQIYAYMEMKHMAKLGNYSASLRTK